MGREYAYDSLARPVTRRTARQGNTVNDSFACNSRSELTAAVSGRTYGYSYDNIGNRKTAREDAEEATAYTTGPLNQYTAIERGEEAAFEPVYDADGNQTLIRTSTGIWQVAYNAENRPVRFVNESANTVVECAYDSMGRRHTRKVSVNGTVSSYLRYIYRGYLQIAVIDAVSGAFRWFLFRDPTQHYAPAAYPQRRRPAHPVEQRIQRGRTGACLLQLPSSQSARRQVDQPRSYHGTGRLEFVRVR